MTRSLLAAARQAAAAIRTTAVYGRVAALEGGAICIEGLEGFATLGDYVDIDGRLAGEVIAVDERRTLALPMRELSGVRVGARAELTVNPGARPCAAWLGKVLNAFGRSFDGAPIEEGSVERPLSAAAAPPSARRGVGVRVNTGLAAFDTFLPLCRGQRIGLFAGSGVGKSTLLASLARGVDADIVVCALIGERSREVREFVEETLGPEGRARSVVVASTSEDPAPVKRRAALLAMTIAEHFRDQGKHVLLLFDSVTRFADAWREIGLTAGETPSLRAYPPSTFRTISGLAERSGPGSGSAGDITAIFTVLVAGSDMDEPVADMMRGILDGHVVLERAIAERGRFPAIDVRRSVSRALPKAATPDENAALGEARGLIAAYEEAAMMIQSGLYARGADPVIDRAIEVWPALDAFVGAPSANCEEAFQRLGAILGAKS
jgi:flagellum-specific ATP synthase